jgi:LuxR family quorum-sensing system transcriptional regulator SolR
MQIQSNHISLVSAPDVKNILKPLNKYNIFYFSYTKSYIDGSRLRLTSDGDTLKAYFDNKMHLIGVTEAQPKLYTKQAVLWSTLPRQQTFQWVREKGNIDHGVYLINPYKDHTETIGFASNPFFPEVMNFYLNNLDILENFVHSFKEQASSLLTLAEKNKIVSPFSLHAIKNYKIIKAEHILKLKYKLSKKQNECAHHLLNGATAKEISVILQLSPRTVEKYLEIIKMKFEAVNKAELIKKLIAFYDKL